MIAIKRIYDSPAVNERNRILVDRLWPRGIRKQQARISAWMRELAPSDELRRYFAHDPTRWKEFRRRYLTELKRSEVQPLLAQMREIANQGALTLFYSAKDRRYNQAIVLKELLEQSREES